MVLELKTDNQTIINDVNFEYTIFIDDLNKGVISLIGNTPLQLGLLNNGNLVKIYRDGNLDFVGRINSTGNIEGNSLKLLMRGEEEEYVKDKCDISILGTLGVWKNTASATIFSAILNSGVNYSAGTINTGVNIDFKVANSDSKWNAITNLINKVGQFKFIDYPNQEVDILNSIGNSNVDILNEGTDFDFLYFQNSEPKAKKIIVYGKGDGVYQITATATSGSYTAGEDNTEVINDPTIISVSEAQKRADIELAKLEQNIKVYDIPINNPYKTYTIGDTLIINAPSYNINGDSVKIVSITRGRSGGNEFLRIEVTNTEFSRTLSSTKQKLAQQQSENRNKQTFMQGSGNTLTFNGILNAKSGAPLRVEFELSDSFIKDEAGNIRVNEFVVDYDVDPYRKEYGTASFTGSDPQVQNSSGSDAPGVSGTGGSNTLRNVFVSSAARENDGGTGTFLKLRAPYTPSSMDFAFIDIQLYISGITGSGTLAFNVYNNTVGATVLTESTGLSSDSYIASSNPSTDASINVGRGDWLHLNVTSLPPGGVVERGTITCTLERDHNHSAGSLAADNHNHTDGSYDINASDLDYVSIGDDVSDAGSLNATSVVLRLYHWNGSAWILKNTIAPSGVTLAQGVDISNGGTYPDASGFWKVEIEPNGSDPDLVQSIIRLKHNLDN